MVPAQERRKLDRVVEIGVGHDADIQISCILKILHCSPETHSVHCSCICLDSYCDYGADCGMVMTASDGQALCLKTHKQTTVLMRNDAVKFASTGFLRRAVEILIPRAVMCICLDSYCDYGADCGMVMTASDGQALCLKTDKQTTVLMRNDAVKFASTGFLRCAVEILIHQAVMLHEGSMGRHKMCHVCVC